MLENYDSLEIYKEKIENFFEEVLKLKPWFIQIKDKPEQKEES